MLLSFALSEPGILFYRLYYSLVQYFVFSLYWNINSLKVGAISLFFVAEFQGAFVAKNYSRHSIC